MSKRHSDGLGVGRKAKRQRHHLYFVLNDGDGYAIRKMNLSSDYDSDDDAARHEDGTIETADVVWSPLPRVLIRLPSRTGEFFIASGTKILVTGCSWPKRTVPAFDVRKLSLTPGPRPHTCPRNPIYMPVGRNIVSLDFGSAEFLGPPPSECSYSDWSWKKLDKAPFRHHDVTCHAAHPDGRTLFVSAVSNGSPATFTLDTEDGVWKQHGNWKLPFKGQALFDPVLDAWVGLSGDKRTLGYLCSCDVVSINSDAGSTVQPSASDAASVDAGTKPTACGVVSTCADPSSNSAPAWKLCKEKMFCVDPSEKHYGAALVYMRGRSKFCLLQCLSATDENDLDSDDESNPPVDVKQEDLPRCFLVRLTTFTLKYDKNGELKTAKRRRVRNYELLPHADLLLNDIRAFWI